MDHQKLITGPFSTATEEKLECLSLNHQKQSHAPTNKELPQIPCLIDAQAGCDSLAGNKLIQPHGVDAVLPVFLASWGQNKQLHKLLIFQECG